MQAPRFTTRAVVVSTACVALAIVWLRDFLFFMRDLGGVKPPLNWETWSFLLRYLAAGGLLGLAVGALFSKPVVWFLLGVLLAVGFAFAGMVVADY